MLNETCTKIIIDNDGNILSMSEITNIDFEEISNGYPDYNLVDDMSCRCILMLALRWAKGYVSGAIHSANICGLLYDCLQIAEPNFAVTFISYSPNEFIVNGSNLPKEQVEKIAQYIVAIKAVIVEKHDFLFPLLIGNQKILKTLAMKYKNTPHYDELYNKYSEWTKDCVV